MPQGLKRFQHSRQSHFVTFTCYHRQRAFDSPHACDLFVEALEHMRRCFAMPIYGYVVMPDHALLISEPEDGVLADAIRFLKLSFSKRLHQLNGKGGAFWQKRYYDRNVRDEREFQAKLRYLHRNPVKKG